MITQKYIKEYFKYDHNSGDLIRTKTRNVNAKKGSIVGCIKKDGCTSYKYVKINGRSYSVHRIIWMYVYGKWPDVIDHIDHNGLNNKLYNLRSVTNKENLNNRRESKQTKSGVPGVYWSKKNKKWYVTVYINERLKCFGSYILLNDAIRARHNAEA